MDVVRVLRYTVIQVIEGMNPLTGVFAALWGKKYIGRGVANGYDLAHPIETPYAINAHALFHTSCRRKRIRSGLFGFPLWRGGGVDVVL